MNTRIREVRTALKMTMDAFGQRIGVQKSAISKLERGENNLTDQMAKSICREFNVSYEWLMSGDGEMFTDLPQTILDELCQQYDLDDFDRALMQMYINLTDSERGLLKTKMKEMIRGLGYRKDGDHEEDD